MKEIINLLANLNLPEIKSVLDETFGLNQYENPHSDIIKFLLKNKYSGTAGLSKFLELIEFYPDNLKDEHLEKSEIFRETINRIDIVIIIHEPKIIIGIENKINHYEREDQISDYQNFLVKEYPDFNKLIIFLNPIGYASETANLENIVRIKNISYEMIKKLSDFLITNSDQYISSFAKLFSEHLEKFILPSQEEEREIAELWYNPEVRRKLNIIYKNPPNLRNIEKEYTLLINSYLNKQNDAINGIYFYPTKTSATELQIVTQKLSENNFPITFMLYDYYYNSDNCYPFFRPVIEYKRYIKNKDNIENSLLKLGVHEKPTQIKYWPIWCELTIPNHNEKFYPIQGIKDYKKDIPEKAFEIFKRCYEFYSKVVD